MYHTGAGKVDHTGHDVVFVEGGEEARAVPHPVHHDWVDESRDAEGVDEVCHELAALGHSARDDGGRRRAEGILEVPHDPVVPLVLRAVPILVSGERKVRWPDADERVGMVIGIVSKAVSQQVPGEGANAGVEEALEQKFLTFLARMLPALSVAKPACIRKISAPAHIR